MGNRLSIYVTGIICVFISALMYAFLPVLGKFAYESGLTPASTLLLRYAFAFIILSIYILIMTKDTVINKSPLVLIQGFILTLGGLSFFHALEYLPAGLATVLLFTYPVIVALLATVFYKEKLTLNLIIGLLLALSGIALISGIGTIETISPMGFFYALLAGIFIAIYSFLGQQTLVNASPISLTATFSLIATLVISITNPSELVYLTQLTYYQIAIGLALAVISTILAIVFFLLGVKKIGASKASLVSTLEPCLAVLVAFLLLGEVLTTYELIGAALILSSMFSTILGARKEAIHNSNISKKLAS
ncbi:Permease of the drug/metabolite transporter (DMT) superfamily [Candidatus Syntrophocurvum alkaliphilum]|uniref:Permease of the drug/metabolite transporter (DMT) superfamily n=1 Tax=Candidatus Syntrophocurvum alkaliphilum TaxID=2293317 RepID=A0A6I6DBU8_9FIRM|nr:DMT family transporter [Candidatus Syntrophocurvum alkaliphilum]QGT99749.1 Permease of the drug/metabolite transporter (DMT) superfamily [Candidatus Syntrophocurvum alkaliphilum]